ncbi:glycosyltransferase [Sphingobacterium faecium]|uniref:glycosyltransferase n=1 Tax=Sphingobacterium faecium TaxID=34087 RepID=UPI00247A4C36|nr:glycosyltransferase [Sphingobacterium faecium]WGQ12740.1 glycosyltransferase [Sphingobacterium faecium]
MILVDALFINNSGGKILLDYFIDRLEKTEKRIFYLLDERVKSHHPEIKSSNIVFYLKGSLVSRYDFYSKISEDFSSVFCFGNLPPSIRFDCKVFTYLHQTLYLSFPKNLNWKVKLSFKLKRLVWKYFLRNTDYIIVQTHLLAGQLENRNIIPRDKILILPFFSFSTLADICQEKTIKEKGSYIYISNAPKYKNHIKLIEAFCRFYDKKKCGKLSLTVSDDFPDLLKLIGEKKILGYPIFNLGFINQNELIKIYKRSEYLIYPSLTESFGLGILEAINFKCKVIGANLDYMHEVCVPSLTFNPYSVDSIYKALINSNEATLPVSINKVTNKIENIINLLV